LVREATLICVGVGRLSWAASLFVSNQAWECRLLAL